MARILWSAVWLFYALLTSPTFVEAAIADRSLSYIGLHGKPSGSVLQALMNSHYSEMMELFEKASMLQSLEQLVGSGAELTVFAPQNAEMYPKLKAFLLKPSNAPLLKRFVEYHIVTSRITANQWPNGSIVTLSSDSLSLRSYLKVNTATLMVEEIAVVTPNLIDRADGVVHGIDGMLIPQCVLSEYVAWSTRNLLSPLPTGAPELDSKSAALLVVSASTKIPVSKSTKIPVFAPAPFLAPAPGPAMGPSLQPMGKGDAEVETFVTAMLHFGGYSDFAELLVSLTSLGAELSKLVNEGFKLTILAPHNDAVKKLSTEQLNSLAVLELILHYHVLSEYQTEESLYSTVRRMGKSTFNTLRYPLALTAQEADGTVKFGDGDNSALVYDHDIYADGCISVQGIDKVLIPPDMVGHTVLPEPNALPRPPGRLLISNAAAEGRRISADPKRWFQNMWIWYP